jgi:hypothetical protein
LTKRTLVMGRWPTEASRISRRGSVRWASPAMARKVSRQGIGARRSRG